MLVTFDEYAAFAGVHQATVRGWHGAGYFGKTSPDTEGRFSRSGASMELIARLSTGMAARIAMLELAAAQVRIDRAAAAFQRWTVEAVPWRTLGVGWQRAEELRLAVDDSTALQEHFRHFHVEPGAAESRRLMRMPWPPIPAPPASAVVSLVDRRRLRAAAKKAKRRVDAAVRRERAEVRRQRADARKLNFGELLESRVVVAPSPSPTSSRRRTRSAPIAAN